MAYQTGTSTGVDDLLDLLRIFATGHGWTADNWSTITSPTTGKWLFLNNGSVYVSLWSDANAGFSLDPGPFIHMAQATSYNSGALANAQPNASNDCKTNKLGAPFTKYHFFSPASGAQYIHIVVEVSGGTFKHFGFGSLDKIGTYTGGQYSHASDWYYGAGFIDNPLSAQHAIPFSSNVASPISGFVCRADIDTFTNKFWDNSKSPVELRGGYTAAFDTYGFNKLFSQSSPNAFNGIAPLSRALQFVTRAGGNYSPLGSPKDFRFLNISNLNPGQSLFLGSDEWVTFPVHVKNGVAGGVSSGVFGMAYKKNP